MKRNSRKRQKLQMMRCPFKGGLWKALEAKRKQQAQDEEEWEEYYHNWY